MKKIIYIIIAIVVLVGGFFALNTFIYNEKQGDSTAGEAVTDPRNGTYIIAGEVVILKNGVSEVTTPNSNVKVVTRYFGNELKTDLNLDGTEDMFFLLTQETDGGEASFYGVGALATSTGYVGTHAVLIGNRIAPQSTTKGEGNMVVVNYAVRTPGETSSMGKSLWLKLDPATLQFGEVVQNFEGEANPQMMKLDMKVWNWVRTTSSATGTVTPAKAGTFTLTLKRDGTFGAGTDCNGIGGNYTVNGKNIAFKDMISTLMYCEGSQEGVYRGIFEQAVSFAFSSKGELVFTLKNGGSAVFR